MHDKCPHWFPAISVPPTIRNCCVRVDQPGDDLSAVMAEARGVEFKKASV